MTTAATIALQDSSYSNKVADRTALLLVLGAGVVEGLDALARLLLLLRRRCVRLLRLRQLSTQARQRLQGTDAVLRVPRWCGGRFTRQQKALSWSARCSTA